MNDRYGSFYEPSQNPAYRFTLAREVSLLRPPATRLLGLLFISSERQILALSFIA
jgi:hypothetical protein